eukprot:5117654-Prymnesium_polylepis.1
MDTVLGALLRAKSTVSGLKPRMSTRCALSPGEYNLSAALRKKQSAHRAHLPLKVAARVVVNARPEKCKHVQIRFITVVVA